MATDHIRKHWFQTKLRQIRNWRVNLHRWEFPSTSYLYLSDGLPHIIFKQHSESLAGWVSLSKTRTKSALSMTSKMSSFPNSIKRCLFIVHLSRKSHVNAPTPGPGFHRFFLKTNFYVIFYLGRNFKLVLHKQWNPRI